LNEGKFNNVAGACNELLDSNDLVAAFDRFLEIPATLFHDWFLLMAIESGMMA
jgi:hypothetical protein